ncbi:MAG: 4-hydroxy-tetrahydrodipicolinate reductase [Candidatus Saliniplasma sp.]
MINICVAGALGKMGKAVIQEAEAEGHEVVGAIESESHGSIGKTLAEEGIGTSEVEINPPSNISEMCSEADIYISFTSPQAEVSNLPKVAGTGTPAVIGTTGYSPEQMAFIEESISDEVTAVIAPNFSLGVNLLYRLVKSCDILPEDYDFSVIEAHHNEKDDSPSGTAARLVELVSDLRGYTETVTGREGYSPREQNEAEVLSVRAGGIPGIHDLIIAGQNEMIKIQHCSFSREVFAQGALHAAEWAIRQDKTGIFSMDDVLTSLKGVGYD